MATALRRLGSPTPWPAVPAASGRARLAGACARLETLAQDQQQPLVPLTGQIETVRQELCQLQAALADAAASKDGRPGPASGELT